MASAQEIKTKALAKMPVLQKILLFMNVNPKTYL